MVGRTSGNRPLTLENIAAVLGAPDCSSDDVVKTTVVGNGIRYDDEVNETCGEYAVPRDRKWATIRLRTTR